MQIMKLQVGDSAEPPSCQTATPSPDTTTDIDKLTNQRTQASASRPGQVVRLRRPAGMPLGSGRIPLQRIFEGNIYRHPDAEGCPVGWLIGNATHKRGGL